MKNCYIYILLIVSIGLIISYLFLKQKEIKREKEGFINVDCNDAISLMNQILNIYNTNLLNKDVIQIARNNKDPLYADVIRVYTVAPMVLKLTQTFQNSCTYQDSFTNTAKRLSDTINKRISEDGQRVLDGIIENISINDPMFQVFRPNKLFREFQCI